MEDLLNAVFNTLASFVSAITTNKESRAWEISGFMEAKVCDLNP